MNLKATIALVGWLTAAGLVGAQTLNVPPRPAGAPTGTQFANIITSMTLTERENWIYAQVASGNVPDFLRTLVPVTVSATIGGTPHTGTYYTIPDYLAIGTDADYFLEPMTPLLAQRLCDLLGCTLPTRKMVDQIWAHAAVKMAPQPIAPSAEMITVPVFAQHNYMVGIQRDTFTNSYPLGALVGGDKKDVIISSKIYTNFSGPSKPVVIYGWHYQNGTPIQPLYNGHVETYADYSHGIRLVQNALTVDGNASTITSVLTNPSLAALLSDEGPSQGTTSDGVIRVPRYTISALAPVVLTQPRSQTAPPGANPAFQVLVAGDPPLSYRWRFNGAFIPGGTSSSLVLSNVQPADAGVYDVIVSNSAGLATSASASLTVGQFTVRFLSATILTNHQVEWLFAGVPGQSYVLEASTNLADWVPVSVLAISNGPLPFVDSDAPNFAARFYRAREAASQVLTDFETYAPGIQVMFQPPSISGSTATFLDPAPNFAHVTNAFPAGHASARVLAAAWSFKTGTTDPWLRLTTFSAANLPNPTISTNQALQFDLYTDKELYVAIGFRETSTTAAIGADGGITGTVEFIGGTTYNGGVPPKGRLVPAGEWTTLSFFIPYEPVLGLNGNGILESSTGKGVFEHLEFVPAAGLGTYNVWLDNFRVTNLAP